MSWHWLAWLHFPRFCGLGSGSLHPRLGWGTTICVALMTKRPAWQWPPDKWAQWAYEKSYNILHLHPSEDLCWLLMLRECAVWICVVCKWLQENVRIHHEPSSILGMTPSYFNDLQQPSFSRQPQLLDCQERTLTIPMVQSIHPLPKNQHRSPKENINVQMLQQATNSDIFIFLAL